MNARVFDKSKLPSRHVTEGAARAPHRSYLYAMGLTRHQIHQPLVGVCSAWNEAAPCNIALIRQAQAVKKGVAAVGADYRITTFHEKPRESDAPRSPFDPGHVSASMGIYLFRTEKLISVLMEDAENEMSSHDFGHDILPAMIGRQ